MARRGVKASANDQGDRDDRPKRLFDENLPLIQRLLVRIARQHRLSTEDAEDFVSASIVRIIESQYRVFANYRGESNLTTFLVVVFERMCLDFRIAQWGKWRPSAGSRRGGDVAILLERLTMRDGLTFEEACSWLETNCGATLERDTLWRLYASFRRRGRPRTVSEHELLNLPAPHAGDPGGLEGSLQASVVDGAIDVLGSALRRLTPRDRLLLQLRYADGMPVSSISRMLHLKQAWLYRYYEKLVADLRRSLQTAGVTADVGAALGEGEMPRARLFTNGRGLTRAMAADRSDDRSV